MYYILYEGLKIESNEPVYCTVYIPVLYIVYNPCTMYTIITVYGKSDHLRNKCMAQRC